MELFIYMYLAAIYILQGLFDGGSCLSLQPFPKAPVRYGKNLQLNCTTSTEWTSLAWRKNLQSYIFVFTPTDCQFKSVKNYNASCSLSFTILEDSSPLVNEKWECIAVLKNGALESLVTTVDIIGPFVDIENETKTLYGDPPDIQCTLDPGWDFCSLRKPGSVVDIKQVTPQSCKNQTPTDVLHVFCNGNTVTFRLYNAEHDSVWECVGFYYDEFIIYTPKKSTTVAIYAELPSVSLSSLPTKATEFYRFEIVCMVTGRPKPEKIWSLENGTIAKEIISRNGNLVFTTVSRNDNGIYRCTAMSALHNETFKATSIFTLLVQYSPTVTVKDARGYTNDGIRLYCLVEGFPENYTIIKWIHFYGDIFIREIKVTNESLYLHKVSIEDQGIYVCLASNDVPDKNGVTEQRGSGKLHVYGPPSVRLFHKMLEGRQNDNIHITLASIYSTSPIQTVKIYNRNSNGRLEKHTTRYGKETRLFHGQNVTVNVSLVMLHLDRLNSSDNGTFVMFVENNISFAEDNFNIIVLKDVSGNINVQGTTKTDPSIIGIIVGSCSPVVVLALAITVGCFFCRKKRKDDASEYNSSCRGSSPEYDSIKEGSSPEYDSIKEEPFQERGSYLKPLSSRGSSPEYDSIKEEPFQERDSYLKPLSSNKMDNSIGYDVEDNSNRNSAYCGSDVEVMHDVRKEPK